MRCLIRNKQPVYYCLYKGEVDIEESPGVYTGEKRVTYEDPVLLMANVSPATGNTITEQFGTSIQYDCVLVTDEMDCPINENTVLFVGISPTFSKDDDPLYNYIVKKVARSINSISIAISKVSLS